MSMTWTDFIILSVASFWAICILARLMLYHRDKELHQVRRQIRREKQRLERQAEAAEKARVAAEAAADYRRAAEESRRRAMEAIDSDEKAAEEALRRQINGESDPSPSTTAAAGESAAPAN